MWSFSIRLFSQSVAPDGILMASSVDWSKGAVIFPTALSGKVKGRKEYLQPGIYILESNERMHIAPFSCMAPQQLCGSDVISKNRESLMPIKDLFLSLEATEAALTRRTIISAHWWKSRQRNSLGSPNHKAKAKT